MCIYDYRNRGGINMNNLIILECQKIMQSISNLEKLNAQLTCVREPITDGINNELRAIFLHQANIRIFTIKDK
jgi:hypothetical protein